MRDLKKRGAPYARQDILDIIGKLAGGATLSQITAAGGPSAVTIRRWIATDEELREAYEKSKELKAHALIDESLDISRQLSAGKFGKDQGNDVRALDAAMRHLGWIASRFSPKDYGERAQAVPLVPIIIKTTLNLGQDGMGPPMPAESVYTLQAAIPTVPEPSGLIPDQRDESKRDGRRKQPKVSYVPDQASGDTQ